MNLMESLVELKAEEVGVEGPVRVEEEHLVHHQMRGQHPRALAVRGQWAGD